MADPLQAAKLLELIEAAEAASVDPYSVEEIDTVLLAGGPRPGAAEARLRAGLINDEIRTCPRCATRLDLPAPAAGKPTETWRCLTCHSVFLTGPTEAAAANGVAQRALQDTRISINQLPACGPEVLPTLVSKLAAGAYSGQERRGFPRHSASLPAIGIPLDARRRVAGSTYRITTRDVSGSGFSAFTETQPPTDLVLVDFTAAGHFGWQVVVEITRRRSSGFLEEFAGRFVTQ